MNRGDRSPYKLSRALAAVSAFLLGGWTIWALIGATTGWGKLSYAGVGVISPVLGGILAFISLCVIVRSKQVGRPIGHAVIALAVSLVLAVAPVVTLLAVCDDCMA